MTTIKIGKRYKEAFDGICRLAINGCIDKNIITKAESGRIQVGDGEMAKVYIYDDAITDMSEGTTIGMENDGASWFRRFRDRNIEVEDSSFLELIEQVSLNYHRKYSLINYDLTKVKTKPEDNIKQEKLNERFSSFLARIHPDFVQNASIEKVKDNDIYNEAYGITLRIRISAGIGEAIPFLCKVYFNYRKGRYYPLDKTVASNFAAHIESNIANISVDIDDKPEEINDEDGILIDSILYHLNNLFGNNTNLNIANYLICNSQSDEKSLNELIENGPSNEVEIICDQIDIINISYITWKVQRYNYVVNNRPLYQFYYGINNTVNLSCISCDSELLIVDGNILLSSEEHQDENHLDDSHLDDSHLDDVHQTTIHIDLNKDDYGITLDQMHQITTKSVLSDHNSKIECTFNRRNNSDFTCRQYVCKTYYKVINNKKVCKRCPYPEVVYRKKDKIYLTKDLSFDRGSIDLIPDTVENCSICGRPFKSTSLNFDGQCTFCQKAETLDKDKKRTYKMYSSMFSTTFRAIHMFEEKYAMEDSDIILFKIGKNYYLFDKCLTGNKIYLPRPTKIEQGGDE